MIVRDIVQSHSIRRTAAGYGVDRIFIVSDVTGSAESRLYNALQSSGIPQFRDPHPIIPGIEVTDLQASPEGNDSASVKIRVTYAIPSIDDIGEDGEGDQAPGVAVVSSTLIDEETHLDRNGDWIKVTWSGLGGFFTNYKSVSVQRPQSRVSLTRIETSMPKDIITNYLGTVNSVTWSGYPPNTWLCVAINAREESPGKFDVEYVFAYRRDDWRATVTVNIPQDVIEDFPPDVDTGNGYGVFDVYPEMDFNALGLEF